MRLAYDAYDKSGKLVRDVIEATDRTVATDQLRRDGLFVTQIAEAEHASAGAAGSSQARKTGGKPGGGTGAGDGPARLARSGGSPREPRMGTRRRLRNLAMFTRQLFVLSSTGTAMVDALSALQRQTRDDQWRQIIEDLRARVEEGLPLSEAMATHPRSFDTIYRSLVAAGESGGQFEAMLDRLSVLVRKEQKTRSTVIGALTYPILLLGVSLAVLVGMLLFVLPRFTGLFKTLNMPLPPTTKILIFMSTTLQAWWWLALMIAAGVVVASYLWLRSDAGRVWRDTVILRIPQVGVITRSFITARIARLLGVLIQSQVSLLEALALTREAAGNIHYRSLVERAEEAVQAGEPISAAFADERLISPSVYEAIRSGEATGQIAPLLLNLADFMDDENETILRSLTSLLEPAILVFLGALVAVVALSMFLPLFDLTAQAGQ